MNESQIRNIESTSGRNYNEILKAAGDMNSKDQKEIIKYIKKEFGLKNVYASLIVNESRKGSTIFDHGSELIQAQYKGKEILLPLFYAVIGIASDFGTDLIYDIKRSYVCLKRKKLFAAIQPYSRAYLNLGLCLKAEPTNGRLELAGSLNSICSHSIKIEDINDIDDELTGWLKKSYDRA
jgi:hypothetical protein